MARKRSRRDFLRGASAADAAGAAADRAASPGSARASYAVHVSRKAMACQFEVVLNAGQYEDGTEIALDALDLVDRLEAQLSYFRPDSEISHINRSASDGPVIVQPRLFSLLSTAQEIYEETEGAFDLTATPLWKAWGFARGQGRLAREEEITRAMEHVGGCLVELDDMEHTVRFLKPDVELNLGSIGKGYALDRVAEVLDKGGIDDYLIQGGQSSVVAKGTRLSGDSPDGWLVGLGHPLRPGTRLGFVRVRDRALATSGSASQFFRHKGRRYSHIIDPRTGHPSDSLLSATVIVPEAARADAFATAFFVMGREAATEFCSNHPGIAAVLIGPAKGSPGFEVHTVGIEDKDFLISGDSSEA